MADKCFCHLNGYQVKDAVARKQLEEIITSGAGSVCQTNGDKPMYFWVGTQAEYNELSETKDDCFYIITDDPSFDNIQEQIAELSERLNSITDSMSTQLVSVNNRITIMGNDHDQDLANLTTKHNQDLANLVETSDSWQPKLLTADGSDLVCTYIHRSGEYSRVGNLVTVRGYVKFKHVGNNDIARISLPFKTSPNVGGGSSVALTIIDQTNCFEDGTCLFLYAMNDPNNRGSAVPMKSPGKFMNWVTAGTDVEQTISFSGTYICEV